MWSVAWPRYRSLRPLSRIVGARCAGSTGHADEYGFETSKVVIEGQFAGGHLSLITGMIEPSAGFDNQCPGREKLRPAAIVNYFGITDVADLLEGPNTKDYALMWFAGLPDRIDLAKKTYVREGLPPIITIQGDHDTVPYGHGVRLHEGLDRVGVPNQLVTIPQGGHDGWSRDEHLLARQEVVKFLKQHGILGD